MYIRGYDEDYKEGVSLSLENTVLGNHSWMKEPSWKSRFPEEKFQQMEQNKMHLEQFDFTCIIYNPMQLVIYPVG